MCKKCAVPSQAGMVLRQPSSLYQSELAWYRRSTSTAQHILTCTVNKGESDQCYIRAMLGTAHGQFSQKPQAVSPKKKKKKTTGRNSYSAAAGGDGLVRRRNHRFDRIMGRRMYSRATGNCTRNRTVYDKLSRQMQAAGFTRSTVQCCEKI